MAAIRSHIREVGEVLISDRNWWRGVRSSQVRVFIPIFFIGTASTIAVVLVNVLVFLLGVFTIREGARKNHLGLLNYGLLIITALIICRFFDTDLSFVARGLLFVGVGAGFFFANYWMIQKRKEK